MYLKGLDMCTCVQKVRWVGSEYFCVSVAIFCFQTNFFSFTLHKGTTKASSFSLVHFLLKMCPLKGKLRVENIN